MPVYTCQRCFKIFKQKSHYIRHQQRKYPCNDNKNPLEKVVEKVIHNMNNHPQEKMDNVSYTSSTSSISKSISYHSPLQLLGGKDVCIIHENCMTSLQSMEDNSIDCVITDPPYFIDKLDNAWSSKNIEKDEKWIIDCEARNDNSIYVNAKGQVFPCSYIARDVLENKLYPLHPIDYPYNDKYNNAKSFSLKDIVYNDDFEHYNESLKRDHLKICKEKCGRCV